MMSVPTKRQRTTTASKEEEEEKLQLPILPASHWTSLGFEKDVVEVMEKFQQNLLNGWCCTSEFGPFVPYHESSMPYWEAYGRNRDDRETKEYFGAKRVELPAVVWKTITPKLSNITKIYFDGCRLDGESLCGFSRFLSSNKTLTSIDIQSNDITDLHAAQSLSLAMKNHPALQKFSSIYSDFGGSYHLDSPQPEIAAAIIDGCENLAEVWIIQCGMDDNCAAAYPAMIKRNKNIKTLGIYGNGLTEVGVNKITEGMYDTSSLNAIVDSNHKCSIYFSEENDDPNRNVSTKMMYVNSPEYPEALKIRYKVQRALFGVGREPEVEDGEEFHISVKAEEGKALDLSYFGDVSVKLIPLVLKFMLKQRVVMAHKFDYIRYFLERSWFEYYKEEDKVHLNRMYQVFKGVCVPLLFG